MTCLQHENRLNHEFRMPQPRRVVDQAASLRLAANRSTPRMELVARVRAQLAAGTYDVDGKFDHVLNRLLDLM